MIEYQLYYGVIPDILYKSEGAIKMNDVMEKIKEQAVKVKDGAVKLTRKVVGKTNNVVDQTKVKFAISDVNSKINDVYTKIGEELYKSRVEGTSAPDFAEEYEKLDGLHSEVEDLNAQLSELKETTQCPSCKTYNDKNNEYCSKCGAYLGVDDEVAEDTEDYFDVEEL